LGDAFGGCVGHGPVDDEVDPVFVPVEPVLVEVVARVEAEIHYAWMLHATSPCVEVDLRQVDTE